MLPVTPETDIYTIALLSAYPLLTGCDSCAHFSSDLGPRIGQNQNDSGTFRPRCKPDTAASSYNQQSHGSVLKPGFAMPVLAGLAINDDVVQTVIGVGDRYRAFGVGGALPAGMPVFGN